MYQAPNLNQPWSEDRRDLAAASGASGGAQTPAVDGLGEKNTAQAQGGPRASRPGARLGSWSMAVPGGSAWSIRAGGSPRPARSTLPAVGRAAQARGQAPRHGACPRGGEACRPGRSRAAGGPLRPGPGPVSSQPKVAASATPSAAARPGPVQSGPGPAQSGPGPSPGHGWRRGGRGV